MRLWGPATGCRPAKAAPTVKPQKPDSVIGLSMTLFSPKRSNNPLVTLYLRIQRDQQYDLPSSSHHRLSFRISPISRHTSLDGVFAQVRGCLRGKCRSTYAPLYCATSSPNTKTLSFDSSSSANASFSASLTATSLTPLGVAYRLRFTMAGIEAEVGRMEAVRGFEGNNRATGLIRRETTMTHRKYQFIDSEQSFCRQVLRE